MKPAVLFVHSNSELYGADFILLEAVRALKTVVIPIVALPGEGDLKKELEQEGVKVILTASSVLRRVNFKPAKLPGLIYDLHRDTGKLINVIREEDVKLVYSNTGAVITGALAARICRLPNLYHIHEIVLNPPWLAKTIARLILGNSCEVIAVSGAVRDQLLRYGRPGDPAVRVIHNGLDPSPFDGCEGVEEARREMGAGPENVLFGVIGRIHPWKGQSYFVDAARRVADKCRRARFVIVGGTFAGYEYLLGELKEQVRRLGMQDRLRILPFRKDVPRLMRALDVFVLPSTLPDPLPTVVLEAMAAEKPVVATVHGGTLEMVVHDRTGLLVPFDDVNAFAEVLTELVENEEQRKRLGHAGRQRLEAHFTRQRFHEEIRQCLEPYLREKIKEYNYDLSVSA